MIATKKTIEVLHKLKKQILYIEENYPNKNKIYLDLLKDCYYIINLQIKINALQNSISETQNKIIEDYILNLSLNCITNEN
jgi:hypothetical protein